MRCFKPLNSSPSLLVCALAGAFACAASAAPAANDVQSIWLAPTGTSPLSAKAPLRIEISPAESQCRAAYGNEWYERCQLTLGKPGTRVQGVQLTPETAGEPALRYRIKIRSPRVMLPRQLKVDLSAP